MGFWCGLEGGDVNDLVCKFTDWIVYISTEMQNVFSMMMTY